MELPACKQELAAIKCKKLTSQPEKFKPKCCKMQFVLNKAIQKKTEEAVESVEDKDTRKSLAKGAIIKDRQKLIGLADRFSWEAVAEYQYDELVEDEDVKK